MYNVTNDYISFIFDKLFTNHDIALEFVIFCSRYRTFKSLHWPI